MTDRCLCARGFRLASIFTAIALLTATWRPASAASIPKPEEIVQIASATLDQPLGPGKTRSLVVDAEVREGWHINSDHPNNPDYVPTHLSVSAPSGVEVGATAYPPAQEVSLGFSAGEKLSVFTGALRFTVPLKAKDGFKSDPAQPVTITLDYQPCNDTECLRPVSISASAALATADADSTAGHDYDDGGTGPPSDGWLAGTFETHGYALGFLLVLLGGLALNLTPCVYPLIGVTIAYFGNQGGTTRKLVSLATTYVLGIALMFSAVGVAAALSGGLFGAAMQNRYVLAAIAGMLLALAASSFGLFSLQAPQWMMRRVGAAKPGYAGALAMGFGMGIVAAPCIGPVVLGLLLLAERSQSPAFGFALFFVLAVGLGLPYIGLALAAGKIRALPRSGEWLRWVEQLFGFVLVGLALYFLDPIIPGRLLSTALPFYAAAVGLFLGFATSAGRGWRPFQLFKLAVGSVSALALIYLLLPMNSRAELKFDAYDSAMLASARATGKPVVIDFSADWCIPCREMERTTFVDPAVVSAASRFVRLRADLTEEGGKTDALVKQFSIEGVPTTVFIDSHGQVRKQLVGYTGPAEFLDNLRATD